MRTRNSERGASHWPFIITLVLLLIFIFMWFGRKGDSEKLEEQVAAKSAELDAAIAKHADVEDYLVRLSEVVGWKTVDPKLSPREITNIESMKLAAALDGPGSAFVAMRDAATQTTTRALYKGLSTTPAAVKVAEISQAFQDKVAEVIAANPGAAPIPPKDADDKAGHDEYKRKREAYDKQLAIYKTRVDEALAMKEFPEVSPVLGAVNTWTVEKLADAVKWPFIAQPAVPVLTLEELLKLPAPAFIAMRDAWTKGVNELNVNMKGLTAEKAERDATIEKVQAELASAQTENTGNVTRLSKEASDAKEIAEKARVESENLRNLNKQAEEKAKVDAASAATTISALKNRIQSDKEVLDAEIARDLPDGSLLAANNSQGIVYIDLGTADKVFTGLKFAVWNVGRGGVRTIKGEIVITQVIDVHYSQARISASSEPLSSRDRISNPFFRKDRPIRLFLAGDLTKYPKQIAVARLKRMNVTIDEAISSDTDYVLIPAGVASGPAAPAVEGAPAAAESEFDRIQKIARSYGANLITETMISAFLDY